MNIIYGIVIILSVVYQSRATNLSVSNANCSTPLFAIAMLAIHGVEASKIKVFGIAEGMLRTHVLEFDTLAVNAVLEIYHTKITLIIKAAYDSQLAGSDDLKALLISDMHYCLFERRNKDSMVAAQDIQLGESFLSAAGVETRASLTAVESETRKLVSAIRAARFNNDFQILLSRSYFIQAVICNSLHQSGLIASDECSDAIISWVSRTCHNAFVMFHIRQSTPSSEPPVLKSVDPRPLLNSVDMDALTKITKNDFSIDVELVIIYCSALKQLPLSCHSDFVSLVKQYSFTGGAIQEPFIIRWNKDSEESCSLQDDIKNLMRKHSLRDSIWIELYYSWFRLKKITKLLGIQGYFFFYSNFPIIVEFYKSKSTRDVVKLAILKQWSVGYENFLNHIDIALERASLEYGLWNATYNHFKAMKHKLSVLLFDIENVTQVPSPVCYSQLSVQFLLCCNRNLVGISPVVHGAIMATMKNMSIPAEKLIQFNGLISCIEYAIINYQLSYLSGEQKFMDVISTFVAGTLKELVLYSTVFFAHYKVPDTQKSILLELSKNISKYVTLVLQFHTTTILANVSFFIEQFDSVPNPSRTIWYSFVVSVYFERMCAYAKVLRDASLKAEDNQHRTQISMVGKSMTELLAHESFISCHYMLSTAQTVCSIQLLFNSRHSFNPRIFTTYYIMNLCSFSLLVSRLLT